MKNLLVFLTVAFMTTFSNAQTTWRVNNNPSADADFETLQAAHDGATAGDIIYLEPSGTSYDTCTFTKQLTVIGPGYFLAENDTTVFHNEAKTGEIKFNAGSEGSIVMGCFINGNVRIESDNILLKRNRIEFSSSDTLLVINGNNATIMQNYILQTGLSNYPECVVSIGLNILFTNNWVKNNDGHDNIIISAGSATVAHNIFAGDKYEKLINTNFHSNLYKGNITDNGSNSIQNNIDFGSAFSTYFIEGDSPDGKYQLADDSPAIGAGVDGEDCGMFGGSEPYVISGIPSIPSIIDVSMPTSGSQAGGLPVTIKIQSNN